MADMAGLRTALVGWKKGMMSFAHTFVVEIEGPTAHFTRVGPGGAHWEPNHLALGRAANSTTQVFSHRDWQMRELQSRAGGQLGGALGEKALAKFRKEVAGNLEIYESQGRASLEHKSNMSVPVSELAAATPFDKFPKGGPPALRDLEGPHYEAQFGAKQWFLFQLPDTPLLGDVIAAVAS